MGLLRRTRHNLKGKVDSRRGSLKRSERKFMNEQLPRSLPPHYADRMKPSLIFFFFPPVCDYLVVSLYHLREQSVTRWHLSRGLFFHRRSYKNHATKLLIVQPIIITITNLQVPSAAPKITGDENVIDARCYFEGRIATVKTVQEWLELWFTFDEWFKCLLSRAANPHTKWN